MVISKNGLKPVSPAASKGKVSFIMSFIVSFIMSFIVDFTQMFEAVAMC